MSGCREIFVPPPVGPDVVGRPGGAEGGAASGQLPDQLDQLGIVTVAAGLGAQHRHGVTGNPVPLGEQIPGPGLVEEQETRAVGSPVSVARSGTGGIRRSLRIRRIVDAPTQCPSLSSSPWIRW
jgi:hypothetical protein